MLHRSSSPRGTRKRGDGESCGSGWNGWSVLRVRLSGTVDIYQLLTHLTRVAIDSFALFSVGAVFEKYAVRCHVVNGKGHGHETRCEVDGAHQIGDIEKDRGEKLLDQIHHNEDGQQFGDNDPLPVHEPDIVDQAHLVNLNIDPNITRDREQQWQRSNECGQ